MTPSSATSLFRASLFSVPLASVGWIEADLPGQAAEGSSAWCVLFCSFGLFIRGGIVLPEASPLVPGCLLCSVLFFGTVGWSGFSCE